MNPVSPTPQSLRWRGVAALLGGIVALALALPLASAYHLAYDELPSWFYPLMPVVRPLLSFGRMGAVYEIYGRWYAVVYLLAALGLQGLRLLQRPAPRSLADISWKCLALSLALSCIGVAADYWFDGAGWPLSLLALLIMLVATTVYGAALLRARAVPAWLGWALAITGLGGLPSSLLTGHVPSGPTIAPAVGWICVGVFLLRQAAAAREEQTGVTGALGSQ